MKVVRDIFVKPKSKDEFLVYSPLTRKITVVNSGFLSLLKNLEGLSGEEINMLKEAGVVADQEIIPRAEKEEFKPTQMTIFPTSDCNLRCVYCYGNAGIEKKTIDLEVALAGVDLIIKNALETGAPGIGISFHGGGEPTFAWDVFTGTIDYAREKAGDLKANFSLTSNGVYNPVKLDWIVKNVSQVQLSMDGPEEIQNKQRPLFKPLAEGMKSSYEAIMKTIARFRQEGARYSIRSTITEESVGKMDEMVRFFVSEAGAKRLHFEPLYECGRCATTRWKEPAAADFCENYLKALDVADELGVNLYTSLGNINHITASFCGAAGRNFGLTPEGYVSSCFEVALKSDSRSDIFFYGKYDYEKKEFEIDEGRRDLLVSRSLENLKYCQDCFVKWNCAGDCLAKASLEGDMFDTQNYKRCETRKMLAGRLIERELDKGG